MTPLIEKVIRHIRVLLVEDNKADARLVREALKMSERQTEVTVAKDGQEAIEYLKGVPGFKPSCKPDIIFLDLNVPKKSGLEVLAEIKSDPSLEEVPVIVLSASNLDADIRRAYDSHANFYINKPSHFDKLFAALRYVEEIWLKDIR